MRKGGTRTKGLAMGRWPDSKALFKSKFDRS